jgi:hypothetical protein
VATLGAIGHAYTWNDAVLLLSYLNGDDAAFELTLRDADRLKKRIDGVAASYAVAVKGQTFPPARLEQDKPSEKVTFIKASSWAMANCFEIEKTLGPELRKPWYVDSWIATHIRTSQRCVKRKVNLLPAGKARNVHVYDGYLWEEPLGRNAAGTKRGARKT